MKKCFVLFFLVALSISAFAAADVGRYQLFQGYYKTVNLSGGEVIRHEEKGIFKIDTVTGKVWEYVFTDKARWILQD